MVYAADLTAVDFGEGGGLTFDPEAVRARLDRQLVVRSDYRHALAQIFRFAARGRTRGRRTGVMEHHVARW